MTHTCRECGWLDFDNTGGPIECPECGGSVAHVHDEADDLRMPRNFVYDDEPDVDPYAGGQ